MDATIASSPADEDRALLRLVFAAAAVACAVGLVLGDQNDIAARLVDALGLGGLDEAAVRFFGAAFPF
jgi:hypothetical protein